MSFFKKLKDKLFKSSSKIDEGLDAIVSDGGEEDVVEVAEAPSGPSPEEIAAAEEAARLAQKKAEAEERARQEALEAERAAERQRQAYLEREREEERKRQEQLEAEREAERLRQEELEREREAERQRQEELEREREAERQRLAELEAEKAKAEAEEQARIAAEQKAAEEAAQAAADVAEKERLESLARQQEEERKRSEVERDAERQRLEAEAAEKEAQRQREAEEALRREEERQREEAEAKGREEARLKEEAEAQAREEARLRQEVAAAAREAERERLAEEARIAEEERLAALAARPTPRAVMEPMTTLTASPLDEMEGEAEPEEKKGLLGRLFGGQKKTVVRRTLDDDMLEKLEELLITADMGVDTALRVTANMAEGRMGKKLSVEEIKTLLSQEVTRIMDGVAKPMPLYSHKPQVVLVVGVNGSGKTTTIGKLASQFKAAGKSVVIAAGDTFRAAAVEQLQVWGDRAGVPVLTAPEGTDPASLAFDAMDQAQKDGADLLMIDTAGRLQNRSDLMEELSKIVRVIRKKDPDAPHNTLLVLDATTGQNALSQVKTFQELADVSGLVMTKLDGTAKGGVLVALADKFGLPIHAIGVGEQIDDLAPFDPEDFAKALVGLE